MKVYVSYFVVILTALSLGGCARTMQDAAASSNLIDSGAPQGDSPSGIVHSVNGSNGVPLPTSPSATSPSPPLIGPAVKLDAEERAFLVLINAYRASSGAPALQVSITLTQASSWMSRDMAAQNYFSHTDLMGRDSFARMASFGYTNANSSGENIAAGNETAQATFTQWKNSPGHNANMLNPSYRAIGIGRAKDPNSAYGWYWTTDFGSAVDATL